MDKAAPLNVGQAHYFTYDEKARTLVCKCGKSWSIVYRLARDIPAMIRVRGMSHLNNVRRALARSK